MVERIIDPRYCRRFVLPAASKRYWSVPLFLAIFNLNVFAGTTNRSHQVSVILGKSADGVERLAATELCGYLLKLFGIRTKPESEINRSATTFFLLGPPERNS